MDIKFIVEVDAQDGTQLLNAYENIGNKEAEVIALISNPAKLEIVRKALAHIPHHIVLIPDVKRESLINALKTLGIEDYNQSLFISNQEPILESSLGWIYTQPLDPQQLLTLANKGWFPKAGRLSSLTHFVKRDYRVRQATIADLPILVKLEDLCWPKGLGMPIETLKNRITIFPEGQLVLENDAGVEGVVYSQRIAAIEPLWKMQADRVHALHNPEGSFVQLLALNINPEQQKGEHGSELLEFCLQYVSLIPNVTNVIGVTRCIKYPGSDKISMEAYLQQTPLDPVPQMHVAHGAKIQGVVENYRPKDVANDGYGILVYYSLKDRSPEIAKHTGNKVTVEITRELIADTVDKAIKELMSDETKHLYMRSSPLMELGFDSFTLMELRSKLNKALLIELPPTFFFEYGTAEKTIQYLITQKMEPFKDWLYEITWRPSALIQSQPFIPDRLWIIFEEQDELSIVLQKKLIENLQYCVSVRSGEQFLKLSENRFVVDPNSPKDFVRLLQELPHLSQLSGVINLWSYSVKQESVSYPHIEETLRKNCSGLIYLANALAATRVPKSAKLWVVNSSVVSDGTLESLINTSYVSLCKVISAEYPNSKCTHLALDPKLSAEENCQYLLDELCQVTNEQQIAWRSGERLVARMVPSRIETVRVPVFDANASYLIAGGLRPLGLHVARWYVDHGAKNLILLDEHELNSELQAEVDLLRALGTNIEVFIADFDDLFLLEKCISKIKNLKGVIHTAGMIDQDLLVHMTWGRFKNVNRIKIAGSWNLHTLTKKLPLDHFILFSTCLIDIAPEGRAFYLVGNSFLDGLSYYRKKLGLPSLTIDWGPWIFRQMLVEHIRDLHLASRVRMLNFNEALTVLEYIFYSNKQQLIAAQIEWDSLINSTNNNLFSEIVTTEKPLKEQKIVAQNEPIAIIGMGCRFPGGADSPEKFWRIFKDGIDTITEVPPDRWDIDAYYDPDKNAPGKMYTRYGGFIDNVDMFDAEFFGISPREAEEMDPQQRIALEVAWEALENAGIAPNSIKGSNTGVFMGICFNDYGQLITQSGDISAVDDYYSTGNHYSVVSGRISYILGLEGPAMAIDTACSSSLVSIDNAVKHLQQGECDLAIAGGVNLILAPETTINFCKSGMLAEDGRCKTFDASANGYVRSEGCGIVILKRLSEAERDNNRILAVIRSTAINQDGASTGLTVPNGQAQEKLILQALKKANLEGKDVDYVEAHGTGTSLGDPIEVKAIVATYGKNRKKPLLLGSAKTNIGHTEAAAGVAGLIKCVLALQNRTVPKHLHYKTLNPYITLDGVEISKDETPFGEGPHIAAVSSFGFSGTNSHAIIESAPEEAPKTKQDEYYLFLSGKSEKAVKVQAKRFKAYLESHLDINLNEVAFTLQTGRQHFEYRAAVYCKDIHEAIHNLDAISVTHVEIQTAMKTTDSVEEWLKGFNWSKSYNKTYPVTLPTYPFERESYWAKTARKTTLKSKKAVSATHEILTERHPLPNKTVLYEGEIDLGRTPLFQDHIVYDQIIFPAAGFLDLAMTDADELSNVAITLPLRLTEQHPTDISLLYNDADIQLSSSHGKEEWFTHLTAKKNQLSPSNSKYTMPEIKNTLPPEEYYQRVRTLGLDYQNQFQGLKEIRLGEQEALGTIEVNDKGKYQLHPAILDAGLQLAAALTEKKSGVFLPIGFEFVRCYHSLESQTRVHVQLREPATDLLKADIRFYDPSGKLLVECLGYQAKHVERDAFEKLLSKTVQTDDIFYGLRWVGTSAEKGSLEGTRWLVHSDEEIKCLAKYIVTSNYDHVLLAGDLKSIFESVQELIRNSITAKLWIVIKNSEPSAVAGFVRTLQNEHPEFRTTLLEIDSYDDLEYALTDTSQEGHVAYRQGQRLVQRLYPYHIESSMDQTPYHLVITQKGVIDNLQLKPRENRILQDNQIEIKVKATGLNFRDVLNAMDLYPGDPGPLGLECSGIVASVGKNVSHIKVGDRVMALAQDSFADAVFTDARLAVKIPDTMSFVEAATIPLVYITVYYCLVRCAKLKKGEKVLIHAAAGGIGLAAIQIAQQIGAEIYATASPGKYSVLKAQGITHIYNSRNTEFADQIKYMDVILNSLTGDFIERSLQTLKPSGRFVEIGKRDIWTKEQMQKSRPDVQYDIVAIDSIMVENPETIQEVWQGLLPLCKPLIHTTFSITEAVDAFKYMQAAKHVGKVIVEAKPELITPLFKPDATYLITAGLSALGLELAKWLAAKGAKHIAITKRREPDASQQLILDSIKESGVKISLFTADVAQYDQIENVIQSIGPSLKGVFHTAGIVDDGIIQQQTWERFEKVFKPKVQGILNLHRATEKLQLDYFVAYSSIVSVFGLKGQSNYAAANAFMDSFVEYRRRIGLPAQSINWGPWGEVGMAVRQQMHISGMHPLTVEKGLKALEKILSVNAPQLIVSSIDWDSYLATYRELPPLFAAIQKKSKITTSQAKVYLLKQTLEKIPAPDREKALMVYLTNTVRSVLGLREGKPLEQKRGFFDMGMDSLMAVELKNQLQQDVGKDISLMQTVIFNYSNIEALTKYYKTQVFPDLWPTEKVAKEKAETEGDLLEEAMKLAKRALKDSF